MSRIMRSTSMVILIWAAVFISQGMAFAQDGSQQAPGRLAGGGDFQPITDQDIQMMRKDIRSQRKQLISANMKLTDAEAEEFWPVYKEYISELVAINGAKYALIKQYVQTSGVLSDAEAESAVKQWIRIDQSVADLRMK